MTAPVVGRARVIGLIPTRMDSSRLPGKPLRLRGGRPLLERVVERVRRAGELAAVAVATTDRPVDRPLVEFVRGRDWPVYTGDAADVAGRLLAAAEQAHADAFLRLNGDSPFLDADLLDQGIRRWRQGDVDFVTNIVGRTYPYGISVEVIGTRAYRSAAAARATSEDREHVTSYWYRHPGAVSMATLQSDRPELSVARLVVDTPEDARRMDALVKRLGERACDAGFRTVAQEYLDMIREECAGHPAKTGGAA